jgi:hypothetical protein
MLQHKGRAEEWQRKESKACHVKCYSQIMIIA